MISCIMNDIWRYLEASGEHLEARGVLEGKCTKTCMFFHGKLRGRPFRVGGSAPTLTKSAACAQKLRRGPSGDPAYHPVPYTKPPGHLQPKAVWGISRPYGDRSEGFIYIYIYMYISSLL